ncbi:MAG: hypothetical protein M1827_004000 [Pycnora praestabilis]|nr:MAG: hypothetical protein M1827_004000 [Pycnora praestabilis]
MSKALLITGATGKQGGATIKALLASPSLPDFTIYAVTRNPTSGSAKSLAEKSSKIKLVEGNLDDPEAIFKNVGTDVWGVLSVQVPMGGGATPETEEKQGKALIDAALAHKVKHFVYCSVDRHGIRSSTDPTNVPHFISKHNIEKYLEGMSSAEEGGMTYTILRPTIFMENYEPGYMGKMMTTTTKVGMGNDVPYQLISIKDIGIVAAQAFCKPEAPEYNNKAIGLAGDELSYAQMTKVFKDKMGYTMPTTYEFLAQGLLWGIGDMGKMFTFIREEHYDADIPELKKIHPGLMTFDDWLSKESKFEKK